MSSNTPYNYKAKTIPSQMKTTTQKTEKWFKECVDAAEHMLLNSNEGIRASRINKKLNYNLYNGIVDMADLERVCNPMSFDMDTFPASLRIYCKGVPKINLLAGEEIKRQFDFKVMVTNPDAISQKEKEKKEIVMQNLQEMLVGDAQSEEEIQAKLAETQKYINYEWQDKRELSATWILNHYKKEQNFKAKFNSGFMDLLLSADEVYHIDELGGEPVMYRCNPLTTHALLERDNPYWDQAEIIIEESYHSIGTVIDYYYDELSQADINYLEDGMRRASGLEAHSPRLVSDSYLDPITRDSLDNSFIDTGLFEGHFDQEGNVRVLKVTWKGRRKLGKLTYLDPYGDELHRWVDEYYEPDESIGEHVEWMWVNEYHEGTRIGEDVYVKLQIKPVQYRSMTNPSKCYSGYVGTTMSINGQRALSLMDRLRPYEYQYAIYMWRLDNLMAKNKGKIARLDISKIPDGWELEKWMYYFEVMNIAFEDPFNEGKKGQATGKLSGNYNTSGTAIDLELGNSIQQTINVLELIKREIAEITGVSEQREAGISGGDGLGVTQQAIVQSSHITEHWFAAHEDIKIRVLTTFLEQAKYSLKHKGELKMQHIMDDMSIAMYNIDTEEFRECEYGLMVSNSQGDAELREALKQLAHAGIQNDKISFGQLMDIYTTESMSSVRRKIEKAEQERQQQAQEAQEAEQAHAQEMLQLQIQDKEADRELTKYKIDQDNATKIAVAEINAFKFQEDLDTDQNGIPDPIEIGNQALKQQELASKQFEAQKQLDIKQREIESKKQIENKKIDLEKEKLKAQKELQKMKDKAAMDREQLKAKTAIRNKVSGEK
jgi:hypothetical protein